MEKVKFGIIGCGGICMGKHLPALMEQDNVDIVAFCDIVEERAQTAKDKFGSGKVFTDYKQLLKEDLDAVCVLTPNILHCEMTVAALEAGKHVMCEKPMAMNYEESKKMIDAKNKSGKLLTIGYQNRYRPNTRYLKEICKEGELGEIYYAKAIAIRRRAVPTWGVFLDGEKQGGGPLIDIGTHSLDLTLFMMDNYKPKYAVGTIFHKLNNQTQTANTWGDWKVEDFTVEDSAFGFIVMEDGATIVLEASWALNSLNVKEAVCELCGTKAGADMPTEDELRINFVKNNKQSVLVPDFKKGGVAFYDGKGMTVHGLECRTFIDAILGKGKLYVEPEQAAVVTMILEGIYKSAESGKPYYFNK